MLSKTIKYHPIVVGAYVQWLVINSCMKETLESKRLAGKLKDHVDKLTATSSSTTNSISKLKMTVTSAKKAPDQAEIRARAPKK